MDMYLLNTQAVRVGQFCFVKSVDVGLISLAAADDDDDCAASYTRCCLS
jgi:hypothetical protein